MCCAATVVILTGVYVLVWEPDCFITRTLYSDDVSHLNQAKIFVGTPHRVSLPQKNVVAILAVTLSSQLLSRLYMFDSYFQDNFTTPILIMHSKTPSEADLQRLYSSVRRPVLLLDVANAFRLFPTNFSPCRTTTSYRVRGKWNYLMMIRFWFKFIFELPQLQHFDYIMRLDDDSQLKGNWFNVFDEMRARNASYFANNVDIDLEEQLPGTMRLQRITDEYIEQNKVSVKRRDMLRAAFSNNTVRNYYNNFEVTSTAFFKREDVRRWVDAIDATRGIFKYRWGDAVLRYLTLAIFADKRDVLHRLDYDLPYCHKC